MENKAPCKLALLSLGAKYVHSALAVWYLAEASAQLSRFEHEVNVIEATINMPDSDILTQLAAAKPDILGVSVYIWNANKLEALIKGIKDCLPDLMLVLGGPEVSYNASYWLSLGADFVIQGEGERSFPLLLDAIATGDPAAFDMIPGLWRLKGGMPVLNQVEEAEKAEIDPYSDAYFKALKGRIAYLETSRGCPFQCAFCLSGGSRLRFFPLEAAKKQLLMLSQSGAKTIKLVDRTFNCNADRAYELFEYIIGLDTPCCFHFEVAADLFDERTLTLLQASPPGRIQLEAGLQSFHQPTLDAVARRTSLDKAEQNLKALLEGRNIHIHIDLIAGLPLETPDVFRDSFNRAYAIGAHTLQLGFLKLLHGSVLRKQAAQLGLHYSPAPPYEILSSTWLSVEELDTIRQVEHALQRVYNSGRFIETVRYVLSASGMPPFDMYRELGKAASGHGVQLERYAKQIFDCFSGLPGVYADELRDHMTCDWLCSMRGKNMPEFLHVPGRPARGVTEYAEHFLGRSVARWETAVLQGSGVFIDSSTADPVNGRCTLYKVGNNGHAIPLRRPPNLPAAH